MGDSHAMTQQHPATRLPSVKQPSKRPAHSHAGEAAPAGLACACRGRRCGCMRGAPAAGPPGCARRAESRRPGARGPPARAAAARPPATPTSSAAARCPSRGHTCVCIQLVSFHSCIDEMTFASTRFGAAAWGQPRSALQLPASCTNPTRRVSVQQLVGQHSHRHEAPWKQQVFRSITVWCFDKSSACSVGWRRPAPVRQ